MVFDCVTTPLRFHDCWFPSYRGLQRFPWHWAWHLSGFLNSSVHPWLLPWLLACIVSWLSPAQPPPWSLSWFLAMLSLGNDSCYVLKNGQTADNCCAMLQSVLLCWLLQLLASCLLTCTSTRWTQVMIVSLHVLLSTCLSVHLSRVGVMLPVSFNMARNGDTWADRCPRRPAWY